MKAMILAAGVGSRLDPLTRSLPKPMVPVINRPVIEHIVRLLKRHGFDEIVVNLHYLGEQIDAHFKNRKDLGVNLYFKYEDRLWGDAGSVKRSEEFFDDTFIVIGGDDITDLDLSRLVRFHKDKKAIASIALSLVDDPSEYGIALMNERGRITRFLEKPKGEVIFSNAANTGVYIFEPEIFDLIPKGTTYGFGQNLMPLLIEQKKPFYGLLTSAYWKDVGNLKTYQQCHVDGMAGRVQLDMPYPQVKKYMWIGDNVQIDPTAEIGYPVTIGDNCIIGPGAKVLENSVLGANCEVRANATVDHSILWDHAVVEPDTMLVRCVVGRGSKVASNAAVFDGVIINPARAKSKK
ncbi:MAG: sugar phosphate nucleotidyltransferase [Armatimonadota bacterium]